MLKLETNIIVYRSYAVPDASRIPRILCCLRIVTNYSHKFAQKVSKNLLKSIASWKNWMVPKLELQLNYDRGWKAIFTRGATIWPPPHPHRLVVSIDL